MSRAILFGSAGAPFWGEANTWAYNLFGRMRRDGIDVHYANLLSEPDAFFFRYTCGPDFADPLGCGNVQTVTIDESQTAPALAEMVRSCSADLLVAWGVASARLLKKAAPDLPLILIVGECQQLERYLEEGMARDWAGFRAAVERGVSFPVARRDAEAVAVDACDLLVLPSAKARFAFGQLFPQRQGTIYARSFTAAELVDEEAAQHAALRRPFAERDIDVLFVDLDWRPRVKNFALAKSIAARTPDLSIHLVGEHHGDIAGVRVHPWLPRVELHELLGRSKVLVRPARADLGPGLSFEAHAMGCHVVASPNCAYADGLDEDLPATPWRISEFVEHIRAALSRPRVQAEQSTRGVYADLVETLAVF